MGQGHIILPSSGSLDDTLFRCLGLFYVVVCKTVVVDSKQWAVIFIC